MSLLTTKQNILKHLMFSAQKTTVEKDEIKIQKSISYLFLIINC